MTTGLLITTGLHPLDWNVFRDTLIEWAEQGVDTTHDRACLRMTPRTIVAGSFAFSSSKSQRYGPSICKRWRLAGQAR